MKRGKILPIVLIVLFLFSIVVYAADDEDDGGDGTITPATGESDKDKITKAYTCLSDKVDGKCNSIGMEARIFSVLSTGNCKNDFLSDAINKGVGECWPVSSGSSSCSIIKTSQAILALDKVGSNTNEAVEYLLSRRIPAKEINWYLQIDSASSTSCTISYDGSSHSLNVNDNKKLSSGAGACLQLAQDNYWLRVNPECHEKTFEITCHDSSFLTNLLYKRQGSSTIYIPEESSSASAEGKTTEKIKSYCFSTTDSCNYQDTLWASLALQVADSGSANKTSYLPYLISFAEINEQFLPESFLYILTDSEDYFDELVLKQKLKYWDESGDKFYDTALALLALRNLDHSTKTNAQDWLLEIQGDDGCWDNGNIKSTGFILYSSWPRFTQTTPEKDCEDDGYYCRSKSSCEKDNGRVLNDYDSCNFPSVCCSVDKELESCTDLGGAICDEEEICAGGTMKYSSEHPSSERCCVRGTCREASNLDETECEEADGDCRSSCFEGEEESSEACEFSSDICCMKSSGSGGGDDEGSLLWIIILIVLIVLVLLGILLRNKLRPFWFKIKSKFKRGGSSSSKGPSSRPSGPPGRGPPRPPMGPSGPIMNRKLPSPPIQRRILPPGTTPSPRQIKKQKTEDKELEDTLKKLKDMGK